MTRTLVLNANPKPQSLCRAMAERYAEAAAARHEVQLLHLSDLDFEPNLAQGYDSGSSLEPDLQAFQAQLQWMEHLVIVTPLWWGGVPARFKGLLDRTLLPDFAFRYDAGKTWPEQLLRGRSSELIVTLDTPAWWYRWAQGRPIHTQLQRTVLGFVGIRNRRTRYFGPVIKSDPATRQRWLRTVDQLAA